MPFRNYRANLSQLSRKATKEEKKHGAFKEGIRLRSEGRWEGRYYYQGKQHSIYADTREYIQFLLKKISNSIKDGSYTTPSKHTVSSWLKKWYKEYAITTLRPSTFVNYKSIIRNHINPSLVINILEFGLPYHCLNSFNT